MMVRRVSIVAGILALLAALVWTQVLVLRVNQRVDALTEDLAAVETRQTSRERQGDARFDAVGQATVTEISELTERVDANAKRLTGQWLSGSAKPDPGERIPLASVWTEAHDVAIYLLTSKGPMQDGFHLPVENGRMTVDEITEQYLTQKWAVESVLETYLVWFSQPLIRFVDENTVELTDFGWEVVAALDEIPPDIELRYWADRWAPSEDRAAAGRSAGDR